MTTGGHRRHDAFKSSILLRNYASDSYIKGIKEKTSQKSDPAVSKDFFYSTYEEVTQPHLDCMQAHTGARYIPGVL